MCPYEYLACNSTVARETFSVEFSFLYFLRVRKSKTRAIIQLQREPGGKQKSKIRNNFTLKSYEVFLGKVRKFDIDSIDIFQAILESMTGSGVVWRQTLTSLPSTCKN